MRHIRNGDIDDKQTKISSSTVTLVLNILIYVVYRPPGRPRCITLTLEYSVSLWGSILIPDAHISYVWRQTSGKNTLRRKRLLARPPVLPLARAWVSQLRRKEVVDETSPVKVDER